MASTEASVSVKTEHPQKKTKKFGLVLQGGGALGAYEAGAIECLYERGMECTIVAGASSGAVNAVTLAGAKGYPPDVLKDMWRAFAADPGLPLPATVRRSWSIFGVPHMYRPRLDYWNAASWTYVADNSPARETLERLDWGQINDPGHMRVFVSATGVDDGQTRYFGNTGGRHLTVEHVLASGALPGGFPWVVVKDQPLWDGGTSDNAPLKPVIEHLRGHEAETMPIYTIDVNTGAGPRPTNLMEVRLRMFEILLQNHMETDMKRAGSYGRFIKVLKEIEGYVPQDAKIRQSADWKKVMEYVDLRHLHVIDMKKPAGDSPSDFSRESIERRLQEGHRQMCAQLHESDLSPGRQAGARSRPRVPAGPTVTLSTGPQTGREPAWRAARVTARWRRSACSPSASASPRPTSSRWRGRPARRHPRP